MKVGIWIRVSTEEQAQGESPKNHEVRARMYAELKGWQVVEFYDLSGVSGKSVIEHPEAVRMLSDIASGKTQALIFSKLARLARNVRELLDISEHFQKHNANLVSLEESIDTSTPAGRLLFTFIGALAQWEREEISARVSASVPIRAKQGKPTGGIGSFGYMWVDKELVINPKEAPIVKRAFELFLEKRKILTTCNALNEEGLRARKSKFTTVTLKRVLTDPIYKGLRRANYSKSKGNHKSWKLKPESDWVYHDVEAIISKEIWESVNSIIESWQSLYSKAVPKDSNYMFGGLLVCSCGKKMYVYPYKGMQIPRYVCRACRSKINEDVLEKHFVEGLKQLVLKPEHLSSSKDVSNIEDMRERMQLLKKELQTVAVKTDKLLELYNSDAIDKETFTERFSSLRERKEQLANEIPRMQAEIDFVKVSELGKDYFISHAMTFASMYEYLEYDEKRKLAKEMIESIKVEKDTLNFTLICPSEFVIMGKDKQTHVLADT